MAIFVRQSRIGNWDNISSETLEETTFPADVLADLLSNEAQISFWQFDDIDSPEMDRLVAALHAQNTQNLSDMTFRVITDWRIKEQLGFRMNQTQGDSLDATLNKSGRHWTVTIVSVLDAIKLAKALKECEPKIYSRNEVMQRFATSLQERRIQFDKISSRLWRRLIDERHLRVVVGQAEAVSPADLPRSP